MNLVGAWPLECCQENLDHFDDGKVVVHLMMTHAYAAVALLPAFFAPCPPLKVEICDPDVICDPDPAVICDPDVICPIFVLLKHDLL